MKRIPSRCILVVLLFTLLSAFPTAADETPVAQALARADALWKDGEFDACLAALDRLHRDLPDDVRLKVWEVNLSRARAAMMVAGKRYVTYTHMVPGKSTDYPGYRELRGILTLYESDWRYVVVCVDAAAGKVAWAWKVIGLPRAVAVHPTTDALTMVSWDFSYITLNPETGEIVEQQPIPKGKGRAGLWLNGHVILRKAAAGPVDLWSPASKDVIRVDPRRLRLMSPDESKHLTPGTPLECRGAKDEKLWTFAPGEGLRGASEPRWLDGDVLWTVTGATGGALVRIDGATGTVRWRTTLEDGVGPFPPSMLGEHLGSVDGAGRLLLIHPQDGRVAATTRPFRGLVCTPIQVGNQIVLCAREGVRAISVRSLLKPPPIDERTVLARKARCLVSMGKSADARALMDDLLRLDDRYADAWLRRAEACWALGEDLDEAFSRCRYLATAGKNTDPRLRGRWGLLRLITLDSPPSWQVQPGSHTNLMPHGPRLYVGTRRGRIWEINTQSLEARRFTETDGPVAWLWTKTAVTASIPVSGRYQHVPVTLPDDPEKPDRADVAWSSRTGYDGKPVSYRGRHYRPLGGGRIRVLDEGRSVEYASSLEGIRSWEIHLSPDGPVGYGAGGVYALDEHLCPKRRLIVPRVGGKVSEKVHVRFLRSTADTLGLVVASSDGPYLQVYTRDGERLLNEVPLGRYTTGRARPRQFVILNGGYLFSDRQLTWASATDKRVWRFGPPLERTQSDRAGRERRRYFGDPLVLDGKLFVTTIDGCITVFDVARITAR